MTSPLERIEHTEPDGEVVRELAAQLRQATERVAALARQLAAAAGAGGGDDASSIAGARGSDPAIVPRFGALVVDDDAAVRRMIRRVLGKAGFAVTEAADGKEAVAALDPHRFDVVVSDLHMPGLDGLDLLRKVRAVDLDLPVILVTGDPDVSSAAQAIEHGAFRYLTKPIDFTGLERTARLAARAYALALVRRDALAASGSPASGARDLAGLEVRFQSTLDRLWVAFQPIVDARTGAIAGVEALMRSDEPALPGPEAVLEAARELGQLPVLGRRIRALIADAAAASPLTVFANLHPDDLLDDELVDPAAPLSALAPRVVLEVTERAALRGSPALTARLERLRDLGYRIAVDDIGAGYSGLSSFADLMPEIVKIDMSLVRDVHTNAIKRRTIRSLCNLCHEGDVIVVGEGVETAPERDCLIELGCDLLQGYLLGRPGRGLPPQP